MNEPGPAQWEREYVILEERLLDDYLRELYGPPPEPPSPTDPGLTAFVLIDRGTLFARNAKHAARKAAEGGMCPDADNIYPVPTRSWERKTLTRKVEVE